MINYSKLLHADYITPLHVLGMEGEPELLEAHLSVDV